MPSPRNGPRRGTKATSRPCGTAGVVRGKEALRDYWAAALALMPDLHFDIVGAYQGASVLVINYRNQRGALVNEVLEFDGARVRRGHGTYLT
jgi:hypothetical protein